MPAMRRRFFLFFILKLFASSIVYAVADEVINTTAPAFDQFTTGDNSFQKRQVAFGSPCMPLSAINGQVNYLQTNPSMPYASGTTAILTCNYGFTISGSSNSICSSSMWSPPLGSCVLGGTNVQNLGMGSFGNGMGLFLPGKLPGGNGQCFSLMPPLNGQIRYSQTGMLGSYPTGATASLICNPGTVPTGPSISTCEGGFWQPQSLGFCLNMGGSGGFSMNGVTIANGASVNPLSATLVSSAPMLTGGTLAQCTNLPKPNNGRINYSLTQMGKGYPIGTIATLICNSGLVPSQMTSMCTAGGMWNPQIGVCNPLSDPAGGSPPNEKITSLMSMSPGYCILGILPPLGALINYSQGDALGPYPSGSVATLNCQNGASIGPSSATCESGQWNPPFFHGCSMWENGSTRTFQDQPDGASSPSPNSAPSSMGGGLGLPPSNFIGFPAAQMCTLGVPPVVGGTIAYSQGGDLGPYPVGTIATLQCHAGQPLGLTSSSCLNGMWQPPSIGPCSNSGNIGQEGERTATGPPPPAVRPDLPTPSTSELPAAGSEMSARFPGMPNPLNLNIGSSSNGMPSNGMNGMPDMTGLQLPLSQPCLLAPLPPLNGQITYVTTNAQLTPSASGPMPPSSLGPHPQGTTATLKCNPGFMPSGPISSVCRGGIFEPMLGQCMPGNVQMPTNAVNSMPPQSNDDQRLLGNPAKNEPAEVTSSRLGNASNNNSLEDMSEEDDFPSCPELQLGSPESGHIVYSTERPVKSTTRLSFTTPVMIQHRVGSVAVLQCDEGFISIGDTTARCESGGWTLPILGKCVRQMTTSETSAMRMDTQRGGYQQ